MVTPKKIKRKKKFDLNIVMTSVAYLNFSFKTRKRTEILYQFHIKQPQICGLF